MRRLVLAAVALAATPLQGAEQGFELAPGVFWVGSAPAQRVASVMANPSGTLALRPVVAAPIAVAPPLPLVRELRLPQVATPSPMTPAFQMPTTFVSGPTPVVPQGQIVLTQNPVLSGTTIVIPPGAPFSGNITLTTGNGISIPIGATLHTSGAANPPGAIVIRR